MSRSKILRIQKEIKTDPKGGITKGVSQIHLGKEGADNFMKSSMYKASQILRVCRNSHCVAGGGSVQRAIFDQENQGDIDFFFTTDTYSTYYKKILTDLEHQGRHPIEKRGFISFQMPEVNKEIQIIFTGNHPIRSFDLSCCEIFYHPMGHYLCGTDSFVKTCKTGLTTVNWGKVTKKLAGRYFKYRLQGYKFDPRDNYRILRNLKRGREFGRPGDSYMGRCYSHHSEPGIIKW